MNIVSVRIVTDVRSWKVGVPYPPIHVEHYENEDMQGEKYPIRELDAFVGKYLGKESLEEDHKAVFCEGEHDE